MATWLSDLLGLIHTVTEARQPDLALAGGAVTALSQTANALDQLAGGDPAPEQPSRHRRQLVLHEMATACRSAARRWPPAEGRLPDLVGAAADVVGTRQPALGGEDRWSAGVALSGVARRCADLATRFPPYEHVPDLVRVRRVAGVVDQVARFDPPAIRGRSVLDVPIPLAVLPMDASSAEQVVESAAGLVAAIDRETKENTLHLYAALAASAAAESVARYATALACSLSTGGESRRWKQSSAAWRVVQAALVRYDDGSRYASMPTSSVIEWADHLGAGIANLAASAVHANERDRHIAVRSAVNELAPIATYVEDAVHRLAADGKLFARARTLPRSDRHVRAVVRDQVVVASPSDVSAVRASSRVAKRLSAALATEISRIAPIDRAAPRSVRGPDHYARVPTQDRTLDRSMTQLAR
jgi:hypothetical protein